MLTESATGLSFVELSHEWGHYTPAFPGYADIQIHRVATIAKQGVLTQHIVTSMHHGTHLNAPIHLAQRGVGGWVSCRWTPSSALASCSTCPKANGSTSSPPTWKRPARCGPATSWC